MHIISASVQETLRFGKRIAHNLRKGDIVCLYGDLGSGKTVLTKGIAQGLGIDKSDVVSPTFVLMRRYEGRLPVFHFDLYRLGDAGEIFDLGYEEYLFDNGVAIIEWADRLGKLTPDAYLNVRLDVVGEERRKITVTASGGRYKGVLHNVNEDTRA
ncbi:MAG: tRNA (adenosine(37)-N6)-threonylcarbamoyltransferase complex ATPase subunit type 1 TsaE [Candidatus Omnitrophota bacterium]